MTVNAPFAEGQVFQINSFQAKCDMFSKLICKCGGLLFAVETGLVCKKCFNETHTVPLFIANGSWNRFRNIEPEPPLEEVGEEDFDDDPEPFFMD